MDAMSYKSDNFRFLLVCFPTQGNNIDRLVQERSNSSALAMELPFLHWLIDIALIKLEPNVVWMLQHCILWNLTDLPTGDSF